MSQRAWMVPCVLLVIASGCRAKENTDAIGADTNDDRAGVASRYENPAAAPTPEAARTDDPDLAVLTITAVDIDTRLAALCDVPDTKLFFKFDSAKVRPEAKELLEQIATCATTGPAKGKDLHVVGRTDPRGSDEYNKQLGKQRAEAVAKVLRDQGVAQARVEETSRGEAAASTADPWGWPIDRRVTVRLGDAPAIR